MLEQKSIAVVIPAHDEEKLIGATISGVPGFVDRIIVVDDRSGDGTAAVVEALDDPRVELIRHERNQGVGAAIVTGYKRARDEGSRRHRGDGRRQPDGPRGPPDARRARRARRGRLREGEPALHRPGVGPDPAHALPRQRGALAADEGRVRLLARRRLADGLHRDLARVPPAARPRPHLSGVRDAERHARAPEHLERARARLSLEADLQRRRALRDPPAQGRAAHLVAAR